MTPSWSHDGQWIYFASDRTGRIEVWKMPATGGAAVQVTHDGGGPALESVDGEFLYYQKFVGHSSQPGPLFRMPVKGGPEIQFLPRVSYWVIAVAAKAIYFTADGKKLQRIDLATRIVSTVATLDKLTESITVSPDEAFLIFGQDDRDDAALMLVEGFR